MEEPVPSVLAILVVKDGVPWLQRAVASLARQTHRRLGVLAVDDGSTDGSAEILERVLGPKRVLRLRESVGFGAAVSRAVRLPAAQEADYLLLIHDDVALAPDAVARLVTTAGRLEAVGVVGPKVLDWERPDVLLDIGSASDRFGYPYSPLEEGEIDQGQYDAVREVLYVSSAALLVRREAWVRAGVLDERLRPGTGELDFCWRVRMAGFRVLVDPGAVALHRLAGDRGERSDGQRPAERYLTERIALLSILKNYRLLTLLWLLPLYTIQSLTRVLIYLATRHFDRAWQIARAWGWNLVKLPGTVRRRFRAQRGRRVPDREIARFMSPAPARLQRGVLQASALLTARHERPPDETQEAETAPLPRRVAGIASSHPVAVASVAAILLTLLAFREVLFSGGRLEGGVVPAFPAEPWAMFREFVAGWRSSGFGGPGGGSPALVALGLGSVVSLGDPHLLARLLVTATPLVAGIAAYRALRPLCADAAGSVIGASCYALSAITLWAASEGTIAGAVLLWTMPALAVRVAAAFDGRGPRSRNRWLVGTGMLLAVAGSFFPAVWLALAAVAVPMALAPVDGGSRPRGLVLTFGAAVAAAALVFPFSIELFRAGGGAEIESLGRAEFSALGRLAPGPAPGSWVMALFLPIAAILAFPFVGRRTGWAVRALVSGGGGILLAWLAAAGRLPAAVSNPIAYLVAAAFALSAVIALGIPSLVPTVRRTAFGGRQVGVGALVAVLGLGLALQVGQVLLAGWAVGPGRVPPAWPVVATADPGLAFRVLWLGAPDGLPFPPPGGPPQGTVSSGPASVAYAVTGREGRSVLSVGIPAAGPGHEALTRSLDAILSGRLRHGGAALAPMGIRYVVSAPGRIPRAAASRLEAQLDLLPIQRAGGLTIYRNTAALPVAAAIPGERAVSLAHSPAPLAAAWLPVGDASPLEPAAAPGWRGDIPPDGPSLVTVATEASDDWRLRTTPGREVRPFEAFGWALGFEVPDGARSVDVSFGGQLGRNVELALLAAIWAAALWTLRRPGSDRRHAGSRRSASAMSEVSPSAVRAPARTSARP